MSGQMGYRALIQTRSTLKWFIVIGIILLVVGILVSFVSPLAIFIIWIGIALIALSFIILLYLWLTDKLLPQPSMDRVTFF
jgi:CHASE2 domain-containing sensor protein